MHAKSVSTMYQQEVTCAVPVQGSGHQPSPFFPPWTDSGYLVVIFFSLAMPAMAKLCSCINSQSSLQCQNSNDLREQKYEHGFTMVDVGTSLTALILASCRPA